MAKNSPKTNDEALANNDKQVKKDSKKSGVQAQKKPNIFKRFARLCKEIVSELKKLPGRQEKRQRSPRASLSSLCLFSSLCFWESTAD